MMMRDDRVGVRGTRRVSGFTLVELLVVILIILIVSAVVLPAILPGLAARQSREAARLLQATLVGARDSAIRNNTLSGIRLLPSSTFSGINPATGLLDPTLPLAADRMIPIEPAPNYSEGLITAVTDPPIYLALPYPGPGGGNYPIYVTNSCLAMMESVYSMTSDPNVVMPNAPTSWFWNVRVGDMIQINGAGPWFLIVGPMTVTPASGNPEMFVNVGPPGTRSPWVQTFLPASGPAQFFYPEFLLLANSQDDNINGWVDEGWDGVDNNGDGNVDELAEWENELWPSSLYSQNQVVQNVPYVIRRRPAPVASGRTIDLPTNVVIDLTTWGTTRERSRLPVNLYTGYVDILVYPSGEVVPTTIYSSPASFGMSSAFFHFWLAERSDVHAPANGTTAPLLPLPIGVGSASASGQQIAGEYGILTLFSRTGLITTNATMPFDNPAAPANGTSYNPNTPFLPAQQGVSGGR